MIDGGYGENVPSTIIDLTGYEPVVVREGKGDVDVFNLQYEENYHYQLFLIYIIFISLKDKSFNSW